MAEKKKKSQNALAAFDDNEFAQVKDHAAQMRSDDGARDTMFDSIDEMYLMTWSGKGGKKWKSAEVKVSPDARNAALGAVRLLVATDPIFNVINSTESQEAVEKLESAVQKIYDAAGRAAGNPIHYDALLSAVLYSEMHMAITSTASLVKAAEENGIGVERAKRMEMITPFIIDVWNPKDGHAEFDYLGLTAYYREVDTSVGKLINTFGALVPENTRQRKVSETVKLMTFYDTVKTVQWIDDGVLVYREHGLPFIPVAVQYTEGSRLWNKSDESRQPLLYTLMKSGMWEMQNLVYSVMFTLIRDMGVTPLYAHTTPVGMDGKPLDIDFDESPGVVHLVSGEQFAPLINKGLIDPAVQQGLQIATQKGQESTLYPQALGAPVEGDSTFSELALLSQSGRLPLVSTQRRGGWGLSQVMEMCLAMIKADGTTVSAPHIDLAPGDIPDYVQIETKLEVKLPQDKLQQANIAQMITSGDNPLVSNEWARKEVLNIGQSGDMDRQIWTERAANMMYQSWVQQQLQQQQMAQEQAMMQAQQGQAGMQMPGQPIPQETGANGHMPSPEMSAGAMMPPGQGEQIQGMPPQMGGMMPGAGQGAMPPEGMM